MHVIQFESPYKVFDRQNFVKVIKVVGDTAVQQPYNCAYFDECTYSCIKSRSLRAYYEVQNSEFLFSRCQTYTKLVLCDE